MRYLLPLLAFLHLNTSFAADFELLQQEEVQNAEEQVTVLINAHLVRPSYDHDESFTGKLLNGIVGHVVIVGDRVQGVMEALPIKEKDIIEKLPSAKVYDMTGKFVMPGLHDMHVHNYGVNLDLPNSPLFSKDGGPVKHIDFPGIEAMNYRMAYSGVTSHLDLMSYNEDIKAMKDKQANAAPGDVENQQSRVFMAGGLWHIEDSHHGDLSWLIGKDKHANIPLSREDIVEETNKAKRMQALVEVIREHIQRFQPEVLKVSYDHNPHRPGQKHIVGMSKELFAEFVDAANMVQPGIPVICHVGVWKDVEDCVDGGARAVTHLPFEQANDPAYQMPEGILEKMKEKNVFVIPTMVVYMENSMIKDSLFDTTFSKETVDSCEEGDKTCSCTADVCFKEVETGVLNGRQHFFNDPLLKQVVPQALVNHYFDFQYYAGNPWISWGQEHNRMGYRHRVFHRVISSGIKVLSGTDTMWEGTFFGFSLHRELEMMALANEAVKSPERLLTNMEILRTSTANNHEFLKHFRGQLQEGFFADILVLNSNPIEDIKNTRDIHSVMINGTFIDREGMKPAMKID